MDGYDGRKDIDGEEEIKLNDFYFRVSDTDNSSPSPSILVDSSHRHRRHRPLCGCGILPQRIYYTYLQHQHLDPNERANEMYI